MSDYTLSVVQICPDQFRDAANAYAASFGYGENNLSVKLIDSKGNVYWGCHAWWFPSIFLARTTLPEDAPSEVVDALSSVIVSAKEGVDAYQHWTETLATYGMTLHPEEGV